jgi:hypothetical protein
MLTTDKTTFRRIQTDNPVRLTAFFSVDATDALGRVIEGPWDSVTLELTAEEAAFAANIVSRMRQAYCDKVNACSTTE